MGPALDPRYREGLARLLFAAFLLLFAISLGILFLAVLALGGYPGLLGFFMFIASFVFMLVGAGLAFDGFRLMTRPQA